MSGQRSAEDLDRELIELLNELRVALPGVQVLFAFLLAVPFANGWERVTDLQRDVFFLAFIATAAASILLIAPSSYHLLRWREGDKEQMLRTSNRLAIAGTVFLALGMTGRKVIEQFCLRHGDPSIATRPVCHSIHPDIAVPAMKKQPHGGIEKIVVEVLYLFNGVIKIFIISGQFTHPGNERNTHVQVIGP